MHAAAPRKVSGVSTLLLVVALLALPAAWFGWRSWRIRQIPENERQAEISLAVLASFEAQVRDSDPDGNGAKDFWTGDVAGLAALCSKIPVTANHASLGVRSALEILYDLAAADPANPKARPHHGYWFVPLDADADGKPYRPAGKTFHPSAFGYCAYPARYGVTGRRTYIINQGNTYAVRDTAGAPVLSWPGDTELRLLWAWGMND